MTKAIITGGPGTGKTTLLERLKKDLALAYFVPEPATIVIESERQKERNIEDYTGKFPWNNYAGFGPLVIEKSVELEKKIPEAIGLSIQDRSLIDTIAYAKINKCNHLLARLYELIPQADYDLAFICEPLNVYKQTANRSETREEALATHEELCRAYEAARINVHYLPPVDLEARLLLVNSALSI